MTTTVAPSNAIQRRNALLRATALVAFLMLLTGFAVSLFHTSRDYDAIGLNADRLSVRDSLLLLKNQRDSLLNVLASVESTYSKIMELDKKWNPDNPEIKRQIDPLEKTIGNMADQLAKERNDSLSLYVGRVFDNLLIARSMIWRLRELDFDKTLPPNPDIKIAMLQMEARNVASELDKEAKALDDAVVKGIFGNKKSVKEKLTATASRLRGLANRLRSI